MSKPRTLPPTPAQIAKALAIWIRYREQYNNDIGVAMSGYPYARLRKWAAERGIDVPPMRRGRKKNGQALPQAGRKETL